ncbi:hypothetical protein WJX81_005748 [Elliptochloris bilobata]|uniref:RAP domain-containing protein n=1 Tax=Elliptochloris bilobata TaxID=381761 RepID=A0AAW1QMK2_9CHLO
MQACDMVLWSLAELRHAAPACFDALAEAGTAALSNPAKRRHFTSQNLSTCLWAYGRLNMVHSEPCRRFLSALAARAAEPGALDGNPHALGNVAWGLAVAQLLDAPLLQRVWGLASLKARSTNESFLSQIFQAELSLRLERTGHSTSLAASADVGKTFSILLEAGILRLASQQLWRGRLSCTARPPTRLQRAVGDAVRALGVAVVEEYCSKGAEYSIDLAVPSAHVAIEVDGPSHFAENTRQPLGQTALKRRLLVALGWRPVPVPFFDFPRRGHARVLYMREALAHFAGLATPLPPRPPDWDAAREADKLALLRELGGRFALVAGAAVEAADL